MAIVAALYGTEVRKLRSQQKTKLETVLQDTLYLVVQVTTKSGMFVEATKACKQKVRSQAGIILGLTRNDFNPIENGLTLWSSMAVVAALYGTEVIHFTQEDINELESIPGTFLAHLLGQIKSVSHTAVRKEAGVKPIAQIMINFR